MSVSAFQGKTRIDRIHRYDIFILRIRNEQDNFVDLKIVRATHDNVP